MSLEYFSTSYTEALEKFRRTTSEAGLPVRVFTNKERGPNNEELLTMATLLGNEDAENVLFLNSGTHGVEAFVGAGAQIGCIAEYKDIFGESASLAVVLVHIINPFGAAWSRYVNEDNVDLMKGITYGDTPPDTDPLFIEIDDTLQIHRLGEPNGLKDCLKRRSELIKKYSDERVFAALAKGQSLRPKSIVYNGDKNTWSKLTLEACAAEYLKNAKRVAFVDLHSGVGDWGEAYLMACGDSDSRKRLKSWFGAETHEALNISGNVLYDNIKALTKDAEFTVAVVEGGTVEFGDDFRELMLMEMYFQMYGDPNSEAAQIVKRKFRSFYYPEEDAWKVTYWNNIRKKLSVFAHALAH